MPSPLPQGKGPVSNSPVFEGSWGCWAACFKAGPDEAGSSVSIPRSSGPAACVHDCAVVRGSQRAMHFVSSNDFKGGFLGASCS